MLLEGLAGRDCEALPADPERRAGRRVHCGVLHIVSILSEVFSHAVAQLRSVHLCKQLVVK